VLSELRKTVLVALDRMRSFVALGVADLPLSSCVLDFNDEGCLATVGGGFSPAVESAAGGWVNAEALHRLAMV